jgi:hypothetical protein
MKNVFGLPIFLIFLIYYLLLKKPIVYVSFGDFEDATKNLLDFTKNEIRTTEFLVFPTKRNKLFF